MNKKGPATHLKLFFNANFLQEACKEKEQPAGYKAANTGSQKVSNDPLLVRGCRSSLVLLQKKEYSVLSWKGQKAGKSHGKLHCQKREIPQADCFLPKSKGRGVCVGCVCAKSILFS